MRWHAVAAAALMLATENSETEVARFLLARGANIEEAARDGYTMLMSPPVVPAERPIPSSSVPDQSTILAAFPVVILIAFPCETRTPFT